MQIAAWDSDWVGSLQARLPRPFRRWWARLSLNTQLSGVILIAGLGSALLAQALIGTAGDTPHVLIRWAVVLISVLTAVFVATRLVMRTIARIVTGAQALVEGQYEEIRLHRRSGASAEVRDLEDAFDAVAIAIAEREQILKSEMLQMREVERLKDEFVSTVSHELRTPLTSVRGALGLVLGGPMGQEMPQKARELLRIALQNSERLIRLINDILDVEKMEAGQMTMREERCDIAGILRTTVAGVQSVAHDAGIRLVVEGESAEVTGDPDRLVQVFTNLVSNAIKVSPRGEEVRLRIETRNGTTTVKVIDRGPGIPEEFRDRIFGKFQQVDSSSHRRPGGTGLGLAIARAIAQLHGGSIEFETATGVGTTFSVLLPCLAVPATHGEHETPGATHILILEKDHSMRSILEAVCTPLGEVVATEHVGDFVRAARATAIDAILLDPDLQPADTFDVVRRLRADEALASVPVLLFSSREYTGDELAGVTLAPSHAFVKSRDRETDVALRLRAVLAVRRPRTSLVAA